MIYVKTSTGADKLSLDTSEQLSNIQKAITFGNWINLTSKIGLTCKYRTCGLLTQVAIYGVINEASFTANSGYSFGVLHVFARASFAHWYQLVDSRLYINISGTEGSVDIYSWTNCQDVQSEIHFCTTFAI